MTQQRFVLLDDGDRDGDDAVPAGAGAAPAQRSSRLYTGFSHEHRSAVGASANLAADCERVCALVEADLRRGLFAVLLADYEWGVALAGGPDRGFGEANDGPRPALRFLLFRSLERLSAAEVDARLIALERGDRQSDTAIALSAPAAASPAGIAGLSADVSPAQFAAAFARIQQALRDGDAYQVNYTFRLTARMFGSPVALYRRLRASQPARYGALVADGEHWILSCSPELFLAHHEGRIVAQPMKGTAARAPLAERCPAADAAVGVRLSEDSKNRAENLMIVDLLRNDLGKIAMPGSVSVPRLFETRALPTVWQMTSSVEARMAPHISLAATLGALFPCGSITGAPKLSAMRLIQTLETTARGLYTGAIGWLDAPTTATACPNFCLSVAIRTLTLDAPESDGARPARLGVGAGIVLDSTADDEYAESLLKARFLTDLDPGLCLFETMHATRAGVRHLHRHLARLQGSARALGFQFDATRVAGLRRRLSDICQTLQPGPHRLRIQLAKDGYCELTQAPLAPLPPGPVMLFLAAEHGYAPRGPDFLLRYKTTRREEYDRAWRAAEALGGFDMIFENRVGLVTEGGRSTLLAKLDGRWWTPPLGDGALPGVMRAVLSDDPQFQLKERHLTRDDLRRAQALAVCNAVRGVQPAKLFE